MTLEEWKAKLIEDCPAVKFTEETGAGETYGEVGDVTAHIGPDMQADVVGTWSPNAHVWTLYYHGYEGGQVDV